jgi:hypothetical protein
MSGHYPPGVTGFEREIAGDPPGRFAIDQWIGRGDPWTKRGSWQPVDSSYDYPYQSIQEAEDEINHMKDMDLAAAWRSFSGDELDAEPDLDDFHYRVVDLRED